MWKSKSTKMNYILNKSLTRTKEKSCREERSVMKMEKANNLRIYCSTAAFENIES